ncbi:putative FAD-linked oxidoreductase [Lachnellula suecica]|uniref:Putative FAD-linked oxidoreductase n=1 Tax=Lachnellula suecica TaxID=602035 RepID=A0A8T9BU52_9HELO|nr:putative FAD-linked oxidoreductase [Lachnellula suecica]
MSPFLVFFGLVVLHFSIFVNAGCKSTPGSDGWPTDEQWAVFNETLGGQLIKPTPPGAVCHPDQPTYNSAADWSTFPFHRNDPVSTAANNANNDTCLPDTEYTCSPLGYPAYVVNATTAEHVAAGVIFAGLNNIRLVVKATGHDYLGRNSAPNALSIWTRNLQGITFDDSFQPTNCSSAIVASALTTAAGQTMAELYKASDANNLTIVGGMGEGVGIGGYITGSGHSPLSTSYGMAADNLLELTLATPSGDIITANECQNTDYFYAFRGGGGGTFGVLLTATIKTYPTPAINMITLTVSSYTGPTDDYWSAMTYILTQFPTLSDSYISGYPYLIPTYPVSATASISTYSARFLDHLSGFNDTSKISALFDPIISHITTTWPSLTISNSTTSYPNMYLNFLANYDTSAAGTDKFIGSRLLGADVLSGNTTALNTALRGVSQGAEFGTFLLGGQGVADAQPRGGSDAVNPAWRSALAHVVADLSFAPQNETAKEEASALMDNKVQYLRDLAPDSGAYINEAFINEPSWQTAFWGSNYAQLAQIKKSVDLNDVFWCHPCVGNEGWEEVGDSLCTV